jgi:hypothetical protein
MYWHLPFIEKNRLAAQLGFLQDKHVQNLDKLIGLFARIQARLHHEPLRPTEWSSESQ